MFTLDAKPTVKNWPCEIAVPTENGETALVTCTLDFTLLPVEELSQWQQIKNDKDALKQVIIGWSQICDEQGNDIPFSHKALDAALSWPHFSLAARFAFDEASYGAAAKNYKARLATLLQA